MPFDQAMLATLKSCCKDDDAFERARTLFESHVSKFNAIEATLQHTIDVLQGEVRERLEVSKMHHEKEMFFRAVFENVAVGIAFTELTDSDYKITLANKAFCAMLGYSESELQSLAVSDITHPDDFQAQLQLIRQLERGEISTYGFIKRYLRKDGSMFWGRDHASLFRDSNHRLIFTIVVRDITAEKEANEKLHQSEAPLHWLLNALPFAVAIYKNKVPIFGNSAFFSSRGLRDFNHWLEAKSQESISNDYALIHPDDYQSFIANLDDYRRRVDNGELLKTERRIRRYGETDYRWYECSIFKGDYIDGEKVVVEADLPIEARKQAELELLKVQHLLAETEQLVHIGSWEFDIKTRAVFWTKEVYRIYERDFSLPPLRDDAYYAQIHPDDLDLMKAAHRLASTGEPYDITIRILIDTDKVKWVRTVGQPIIENGELVRLVGTTMDVTEAKNRELALKASEQKLAAYFNSTSEGIVIIDSSHRILGFNDVAFKNALAYYGKPLLEGDDILPFMELGGEIKSLFLTSFQKALQGERIEIDYELPLPVGKSWWRLKYMPIDNHDDEPLCVALVTEDISEKKRAELALQESQDFLQSIYYGISTPIFVIDVETDTRFRVAGVNPAYVQSIDVPAEKVLGKTIQEIGNVLGRDLADALQAKYEACVRSGAEMVYEETFVVNGKSSHYLTRLNPLRDAFGRVYRIVGNTLDITERKEAELALRLSEAMLSDTEQLAHIGSWSVNFETEILSWSDEVFRIYEIEKSLGAPTYSDMFQSSPDAPTIMPIIKEATEKGSGFSISKRIVFAGGRVKWVEVIGAPVQDQQGSLCGYSGYVRDITREREMEADRDLLYAQLLQSQKMESVGVLASGVAHEFNNILAGILGSAMLLKKEVAGNPKSEKRVAQIEAASGRAATIVKQMLGFARQGKMNVQTVDLRQCIADILDVFTPTLDKRIHISTDFKVDDATCFVQGDKGQLEQVILNLAVNARDALMETLSVTTHAEVSFILTCEILPKSLATEVGLPSDMPALHLAVRDNGVGIPKEVQSRIFEPFFTTKEVGKGTGLGLSMVYGIVKNHQGIISVESSVGKGTTFHLYFPLSDKRSAEFNDKGIPDVVGAIKGTILVVDDEPLIREFLTELLEEHGYFVYSQSNGKDGLALFEVHQGEIDLVVVDKNMPELDGEQFLLHLKSLRPNLRIILITGHLENEDLAVIVEKNAYKVFTKPFEPKAFLAAVASALQLP